MKNKTIYKILSILMIFALIITMANISAYASVSSSDTSSITISGVESGVTVTLYRIATVNVDSSGNVLDPEYTWVSEVEDWLNDSETYSSYADIETFASTVASDTSVASSFYSALSAAISSGIITLKETESATATSDTVTISGVEMGLYLIIIEGGSLVYSPNVVSVAPEYDTNSSAWALPTSYDVEAKTSTLTMTKTVTDDSSTSDNYAIGDTINYTIVASVPTYGEGAVYTTYKISDSLDTGLTLNTNSITVSGTATEGSSTILTEGTEYTAETSGNSFTLTFDYDKISSYSTITVTYTATLNQNLVVDGSGNGNTATLTYSNNPYTDSTTKEISSGEINVYTYGIEVTKTDKSTGDAISGAQFTLSTKDSEDNYTVLSFVYNSETGIYYLAGSDDTNTTTTLTTDSNGKLYIYGLDEGTYYLQETYAPGDYIIDTDYVEVEIVDEDTDGSIEKDETETSSGVYSIGITNKTGFSLPVTGGIGTVIFIIVGAILIILGVLMKVSKRRKD